MHVAKTLGNAAIGHDDRDLVQRLRQARPKVPIVISRTQSGSRIAFHGMVQVRKSKWIPEEKHWCIVPNDIPVALFSVKLHGEPADISLCISSATLARNTGETDEQFGSFADLGKQFGFGITGNVVRHREATVNPQPLACMRRSGITSRSK